MSSVKYFVFLMAVLVGYMDDGYAQEMPLDFETNLHQFTGFSGTTVSITPESGNTSNQIARFENSGMSNFEGAFIDLSRSIDLSSNKVIDLRFNPTDNNAHTILLKLESGSGPNVEVLSNISAGNQNMWVPLDFDFSTATISGTSNLVNATGTYSRVTIFIDGGQMSTGIFFIDDIEDGTAPNNPIDVVYNDLVWSDEFDTPGTNNPIDPTKWHHQTQLPMPSGWFNGELQHYTNRLDNSRVEGGFLHLTAKRENFTDQGLTTQFTSARLNSKFAFTYGRVDVRARLPLGDGTWPAIWTLGVNINEAGNYWLPFQSNPVSWPACGEIDIMEHGLGATNHVSAALHTPCAGCFGNTMNFRSVVLQDVAANFHVYSMNWSPDRIVFLIDDVPFYTYRPSPKDAGNWPFDDDQYLLLNVAMGGVSGAVDPNFQESAMVIDYVRVFQNTASEQSFNISNIQIYPNPASDYVQIDADMDLRNVTLFDLKGSLIDKAFNYQSNRMSVSDLDAGIYLLRIDTGSGLVNSKLIIE